MSSTDEEQQWWWQENEESGVVFTYPLRWKARRRVEYLKRRWSAYVGWYWVETWWEEREKLQRAASCIAHAGLSRTWYLFLDMLPHCNILRHSTTPFGSGIVAIVAVIISWCRGCVSGCVGGDRGKGSWIRIVGISVMYRYLSCSLLILSIRYLVDTYMSNSFTFFTVDLPMVSLPSWLVLSLGYINLPRVRSPTVKSI